MLSFLRSLLTWFVIVIIVVVAWVAGGVGGIFRVLPAAVLLSFCVRGRLLLGHRRHRHYRTFASWQQWSQ